MSPRRYWPPILLNLDLLQHAQDQVPPQHATEMLRCFLVFAGMGVKVDKVHQLLMMKNLDDYMLFTKDSVATDTLANIELSSGTIEKNYQYKSKFTAHRSDDI